MPSTPVTKRARGWVFTINNYTPRHEDLLQRLDCVYIVYGREVGASGTPHLQGYVYFRQPRSKLAVSKDIPNAYLDIRAGTHEQARAYCIKDGSFEERGERPLDPTEIQAKGGEGTAAKWREIHAKSKQGCMDWIAEHHPKEYLLYKPRLESNYQPDIGVLQGELHHEWWVGPTGSGKSKALWELYPNHFAKNINKWWDGYKFEEVVAIEEWSPENSVTAQALKRWADRYPFTGEIKGGVMQKLRPRKIIVLSNYTLEQCFTRSEDLEPLKRRFKTITFPDGRAHAGFRAAWFNEPPSEPEPMDTESTEASSAFMYDEDLPSIDLDDLFSQGE